MATLNKKNTVKALANTVNHEGAPAQIPQDDYKLLLKLSCNCMLFEPTFYKSGTAIAEEIKDVALRLPIVKILDAAQHVSENFNLRSISTFLIACAIVKRDKEKNTEPLYSRVIEETAKQIIRRPDMLTELFLQFQYLTSSETTFPKVLHRIASERMTAFSEYQLAKYAGLGSFTLRDLLRVTHVKPISEAQSATFKAITANTIKSPETWNKQLSAGADKKTTWETMLSEGTLGGIAILKNLRNMLAVNVKPALIRENLKRKELFRGALITQIAAANKHSNNQFSDELTELLTVINIEPLTGKTVFLVDVSGSMDSELSSNSELTLLDAAANLASIGSRFCENAEVYSFSNNLVNVPLQNNYPFAFAVKIAGSQSHGGTRLSEALKELNKKNSYDRLIVVTDEQAFSLPPAAVNGKSYIINVAPYSPGIVDELGYKRINGFSPMVLQFINQIEQL